MFHRTPAYENGSLCPGDELVSVNGHSLRGFSRKQTADLIQGEKVCVCVRERERGRESGMCITLQHDNNNS